MSGRHQAHGCWSKGPGQARLSVRPAEASRPTRGAPAPHPSWNPFSQLPCPKDGISRERCAGRPTCAWVKGWAESSQRREPPVG